MMRETDHNKDTGRIAYLTSEDGYSWRFSGGYLPMSRKPRGEALQPSTYGLSYTQALAAKQAWVDGVKSERLQFWAAVGASL